MAEQKKDVTQHITLAMTLLAGLGTLVAGLWGWGEKVAERAHSEGMRAAAAIHSEVTETADRLRRHEEDSHQARLHVAQDLHEVRADIRDLYRVVRGGGRSERLESPLDAGVR